MKIFCLLTAILFTVQVTNAQSGTAWKKDSSHGFSYRYVAGDPLAARFYTLPNGLTVILSVNHAEPRIAVRIPVRTGSNNDPRDHTGLAHYLEHVLFKGTTKYGSLDWPKEKVYLDSIDNLYEQYNGTQDSGQRAKIYQQIDQTSGRASHFAIANEYDKMMADVGSQSSNAHTWVEETVYEEDLPSGATDKFLAIQAERFRDPIFRLFHTELEAVYEEKNRSLDEDNSKLQEAMMRGLFPTHNYGQQTTIGTVEHLRNPSLKAIKNYYHAYYVPNNMAIVMAGDFDADVMIRKIATAFAYLQPKPIVPYSPAPEKPMDTAVVRVIYGPSAESVRVGFRTPAAGTREALVFDLISNILFNGKAGLLDLDLNKQQAVQNSACYLQQYKDYGEMVFRGTPKQGQSLDQVRDLLFAEEAKLTSGNFDEALIGAIAANNKFDLLEGLKKNNGRVERLTDEFIKSRGLNWDQIVSAFDEQAKISKQEIMAVAQKYLAGGYVLLYKKKGTDSAIVKVVKPPITPVETNAGMQSAFVKQMQAMPVAASEPQFLDFNKGFIREKIGNTNLLYLKNKENDLFHLYYRFDMGSWHNRYLPFAAQYLQFLSTPTRGSSEITKAFYNIACSYSVQVDAEETTVSLSGLAENMEKAVALFEDLLSHCIANDTALSSYKDRVIKSRQNAKLNKYSILNGLINYSTFGAQNPFNAVLDSTAISGMSSDTLIHLLHQLEQYPHQIIYYGPQAVAPFVATIQKMHPLPAAFTPVPAKTRFEFTTLEKPQVLFATYDMVQAEIYWQRNAELYRAEKEPLIDLFNNYFGGGMGSIVFQTIRESKALAYSTFAEYSIPQRKEYHFEEMAYIGCQADKMKEAVAGMNDLLNHLPLEEKNFQLARKSILKDIETQRFPDDQIIFTWLTDQDKGWDHDRRKDEYQQVKSLTLKDLQHFHETELANKPYTYCIVGSDQKVDMKELHSMGEVKMLTLTQIFGY